MKKTLFLMTLALLLGCHKSDRVKPGINATRTSLHLLSKKSHAFGISKIDLIGITDLGEEFKLEGPGSEKMFSYEQPSEDRLVLRISDTQFPATIEMDKRVGSIVYKERGIDLTTDAELTIEEQTNILLAITIFRELTENLDREPYTPEKMNTKCMRGAISFRKTKSESIETLDKFVNNYLSKHPECKRKYGVDTGCIWGDFICVSGQQLECDCK